MTSLLTAALLSGQPVSLYFTTTTCNISEVILGGAL
jgi:hypothetical protein